MRITKNVKKTKVTLSYDQLRAIARYEMTFRDILGDRSYWETEFTCPQPYAFTLEDLRCAIENMRKRQPTNDAFAEDWFERISGLSDAFGLDEILDPDEERVPEGFSCPLPMKLTESDYFMDVWTDLEAVWEGDDGEETLDLEYDRMLEDMDRYFRNQGKPIEECEFDPWDKRSYIIRFEAGDAVKTATEREVTLCRRFVDELCVEDDVLALRIKGYSCYGGDRLYPCDWDMSRDCIARVYEKTDDPQCANTLGYIYYYGRCNGGVPEYEQAFRYYSVAAASGLYEGMYKLADMLCHGYGCIKSPSAAKTLYTMVYNDCLNAFLQGNNANFADIALRMGNVYARGIGLKEGSELTPYHLRMAYGFYLQAQYASDLRMKDSDFFGDRTVAVGIQSALEETRAKLPEDSFTADLDMFEPEPLALLTEDNHLCELTREIGKNGSVWLKAKRLPTQREKKPPFILLCCPSINYCERVRNVKLEIRDEKETWFPEDQTVVRYDYVKYNDRAHRTEFYNQGILTAWVTAKAFRLHGKRRPRPYGTEYRLVSVQFQPGGRTYDYLTDREDIRPGDTVIVNGYEGETPVTVLAVTVRRESELPIAVEKYKKILRKAENTP